MKVRLTDNRISLRLSEEDVLALQSTDVVSVSVALSRDEGLRFELATESRIGDIRVTMDGSIIRILLPESWLADCQRDDRIGFDSVVPSGAGSELHVNVEKDLRWFKRKPAAD